MTSSIPISVICLLSGLLLEGKRVIGRWSTLFYSIIGAALFSLIALIQGEHEVVYDYDAHRTMMLYCFIFMFSVIVVVFNKNKVTAKLTEGIALLQSVAMTYWVIDIHAYQATSTFIKVLMLIGLVFAAFTLFHAFYPAKLSRGSRLTLSIWSCFIMAIFASDNIYQLYSKASIESSTSLSAGFLEGLQFFILGVSTLYIAQNVFMLIDFLPGKGEGIGAEYHKRIKELKEDHIRRFSPNKVNVLQSIICILITGTIFYLNFKFQYLPRQYAIWIVFILFPYVISLFYVLNKPPKRSIVNEESVKPA